MNAENSGRKNWKFKLSELDSSEDHYLDCKEDEQRRGGAELEVLDVASSKLCLVSIR